MDHLEQTISSYESVAAQFEETRFDVSKVEHLLTPFLEYLKGKRVLDVGCGPGRDSKYFVEQGLAVTGIDVTPSFIEMAKKNVPSGSFYVKDVRSLDFSPASFDGIWAAASLLHVPHKDIDVVLSQLNSLLESQGVLFCSLLEGSGERLKEIGNLGEKAHYAFYSQQEICATLKKQGFVIDNIICSSNTKGDTWLNIYSHKS